MASYTATHSGDFYVWAAPIGAPRAITIIACDPTGEERNLACWSPDIPRLPGEAANKHATAKDVFDVAAGTVINTRPDTARLRLFRIPTMELLYDSARETGA